MDASFPQELFLPLLVRWRPLPLHAGVPTSAISGQPDLFLIKFAGSEAGHPTLITDRAASIFSGYCKRTDRLYVRSASAHRVSNGQVDQGHGAAVSVATIANRIRR